MTPALSLLVFLAPFADDPLPAGASARLGGTRMRVAGTIHGLQFASAGRGLVAADRDAVIGWDAPTGTRLFRHPYPPNDSIIAGRVTAKFELVLLVRAKENDKLTAVRMNLTTGACSPPVKFDQQAATAATFRPDGGVLAAVNGTKLKVLDTASGKALWDLDLPQSPPHAPAFSADGATIAVEYGKAVRVLDAVTGTRKYDLPAVTEPVLSADGSLVAGAAGKKSVALFRRGEPAHKLAATSALGFSLDGLELFAAAETGIKVFDPHTGKLRRELDIPKPANQLLSPDAATLCCESRDAVLLFDAKTGKRLAQSADPPGLPTQLHVRHGAVVGLLPEWNGVAAWTAATGAGSVSRLPGRTGTVIGSRFTKLVAIKDDEVFLRDPHTGTTVTAFTHPGANSGLAAVCPSTGTIVVAGDVGVARWGPGAKDKVVLPTTANDRPAPTAVATAGEVTAIAYPPGLEGGRPTVEIFRGPDHRYSVGLDGEARKLALSADGGILAAECDLPHDGGNLRYVTAVIDTAAGRVLFRTAVDQHRDAAVAVSADGRAVARTAGDACTVVYEVRSGVQLAILQTGAEPAAVAVDRLHVFSAQPGGPVLVWPVGRAAPASPLQAWAGLASRDATAAAQRWLHAHPDAAVRFAAENLKPVPPADPAKLAQWVKDLDAPQFGVREAAFKDLRRLGELAAPALQAALEATRSGEVRQKATMLLAAVPKPDGETLRALRLIEVLEWQNTPATAAELRRLAAGAPGAAVTRDAAAALARIK